MTGERARFSKDARFVATTREEATAIIVSTVGARCVIRRHAVEFTNRTQLREARREARTIRDGFVERYDRKVKELQDERAYLTNR